jgi:hypothetical protein
MRNPPSVPVIAAAILWTLIAGAAAPAQEPAAASTSCLTCHGDADFFDEEALAIVAAFASDVHSEAGLSCHDCHGGNPDPEVAEDIDLSMDAEFADNPYVGVPEPAGVAAFCGRCHSDPETMRRFQPDLRVDQEAEYRTSHHGKALAVGRDGAATCISCHSVHDIRRVADPESPVYPTRVAETCGGCHGDAEHMAGVTLADGRPLPTDQLIRWRRSVHAAALLEKGDFSAPTCNDCHGNHGAAPPGVDAIVNVCGQCHGREARLFRGSAKHRGFMDHEELMADAGDDGCAACHEAPEPQAALAGLRSLSECATCHGNHAVIRPTIAMLSPLPDIPCAICHEGSGPLAEETPEPERSRRRYLATRDRLVTAAEGSGLSGDALFDRLVDRALTLPEHSLEGGDPEAPQPREEFQRLFEKFRIGKTVYQIDDPADGSRHTVEVVRCSQCHGAEPMLADAPVGFDASRTVLERMLELTGATARAERIVLAARRGGVETRDALSAIDGAVDAQIGLEVLVHAFDTGPESAFAEQQQEGLENARAALAAGRESLAELAFRRRGLAISLLFIAAVAVGLALKIRQLG